MSKELKPCPVCGSSDLKLRHGRVYEVYMTCLNCRISMNDEYESTLIKAWNKLLRLDEKRKAEIAIQMIRECVLYIPASLPKEDMEALEYTEMCIKYAYGIGEEE